MGSDLKTNNSYTTIPEMPIPFQVEIEFSNICNAKCVACPRYDMPTPGLMKIEILEQIINHYKKAKEYLNWDDLPEVIISGGGEPLLNKQALSFINKITDAGFSTSLTTNGSAIDCEMAKKLANSNLEIIFISFWGIEQQEYESSMKLNFYKNLERVLTLAEECKKTNKTIFVKWVRVPELKSSDYEIEIFWEKHGIKTINGYHSIWNRGGLLEKTKLPKDAFGGQLPDTNRRIWCSDLYFSDAFNWKGDCVLCCCNYFTSNQIIVGNILVDKPEDFIARKNKILNERPIPKMCQTCKLPRASRAMRLTERIFKHLSLEDQKILTQY